MDGVVVIGEGEKDEAPMLYNGERVGNGQAPLTDVAVDPIDGTTLTSLGRGNALSVIAVSPRRARCSTPAPASTWRRSPSVPTAGASSPSTCRPPRTCGSWPRPGGTSVRDLTAVILDRDRHDDLIAEIRSAGARIRQIPDGDVAGAISTAWPDSGADILFGIGRHARGRDRRRRPQVHGRRHAGPAVAPQRRASARPRGRGRLRPRQGPRPSTTWSPGTTASSPPPASPTASCCEGVRYDRDGCTTQSLVMRSRSGTVRLDEARHRLDKLVHLRRRRLPLTSPGGRTAHGRRHGASRGFATGARAATPEGTNVACTRRRRRHRDRAAGSRAEDG